jgi:hypothetical protein
VLSILAVSGHNGNSKKKVYYKSDASVYIVLDLIEVIDVMPCKS